MLSLTQSQIAAYIILSLLVVFVILGLLNIIYGILMCLTARPENNERIDINL